MTTIPIEVEEMTEAEMEDALREMTVGKITVMAETGTVQNVAIIISHSDKNAIAVEKPVVAVEDVVLDKTTAEVETKDTKVETVKVDALREITVGKITVMAETGTVQNVAIIISHSERSVTNVDFLEVEEMTDVGEMTDVEEMTDVRVKSTLITIGIALNVTTQISHSARNATAAVHLVQVAAEDVALAEMMVDDPLDMMTEEHLDAMTVEDPLDMMTAEHLDAMTVEDLLLDAMMVEDHPGVMDETEEMRAVKAEDHTDKIDLLNESQENLEILENHVAMDLGMHITARQSRSLTLTEMIEGGL